MLLLYIITYNLCQCMHSGTLASFHPPHSPGHQGIALAIDYSLFMLTRYMEEAESGVVVLVVCCFREDRF